MNELAIRDSEKSGFKAFLSDNTDLLVTVLFYICGVLISSYFFTRIQGSLADNMMKDLFSPDNTSLEKMFVNRFCIYFSIFALTVILGMCLIGFPFLNIIPLAIGLEVGLKTAYYYVNFSVKGLGFALLMIIPQASVLITIIAFTIRRSLTLSKSIYSLTTNKSGTAGEIDLKLYLKSFMLYSLAIVATALVNTLIYYLLGTIISI